MKSNSLATQVTLAALLEALKPALATTYTVKRLTLSGIQTDQVLWSPASGKKVVVAVLIVSVKGAAADVIPEWDKTGGDEEMIAPLYFGDKGGMALPLCGAVVACDEDDADLIVSTANATGATTSITAIGYEIE